jgi:Protein of unknown function (DUF3684)
LASIELEFDDYQLLTLARQAGIETSISLTSSKLSLMSPQRCMRIASVAYQPIQIKTVYLGAAQARASSSQSGLSGIPLEPASLSAHQETVAHLRVATATIAVAVGERLTADFQRSTKKSPPSQTRISVLCSSKADSETSTQSTTVFEHLIPGKQGRIFIGFPTHQTTGFGGHVSAPALVPTVERESIDLADPQMRVWNSELLSCIGIFTRFMPSLNELILRFIYDREIEIIGQYHRTADPNENTAIKDAAHYMGIFTFHETTPASRVGNYIKESFFRASGEHGVPILTSKGVRPSKEARLAHKDIQFMTQTAVVPARLAILAKTFLDGLESAGMLKVAGWEDVLVELTIRSLSEIEGKQFLRWLLKEKPSEEIKKRLFSAAKLIRGNGKMIIFSQVKTYIVGGKFPGHGELPQTVLPFDVSRHFQIRELDSLYEFPVLKLLKRSGWKELSIREWVNYVCTISPSSSDSDIESSIAFARAIITAVGKSWDSLNDEDKRSIIFLLSRKRCMPTNGCGLKYPKDAYFANVKVLPDLPLIVTMKGVKRQFLEQLGVRKVIALQLIFDRLGHGGTWSHLDGIKYLGIGAKVDQI